ncbi:MAG: phosphotransferase family protein [Rudaea sp.]|nr:phosphotransferase family protein [Rudaea sp.]
MIAAGERPLYLREVLRTMQATIAPELSSDRALDAIGCIERVLAHLIVADEQGDELERDFADRVDAALADGRPQAVSLATAQSLAQTGRLDAKARHALADAERAYLRDLARKRDALLRPASQDGGRAQVCSITAAQLTGYLRARFPQYPGIYADSIELIPGGRSKETLLVDLRDAGFLSGLRVMRKDVAIGLNATRTSDEFPTLTLAMEAGVPVPQPLLVEDDPDKLDGTFMIVARVRGEKKGEIFPDVAFPTEGKPEIGAQLAAILARIHQIPIARTGREAPDRTTVKSATLSRIDAAAARFAAVTQGEPSTLFGLAVCWLRDNIDDALQGPIVLRHGDLGLHNMLIDGTTITAMLDWELSEPGYPAADLGALRHSVKALMPWQDFVEGYVQAGGDRLAANDHSVRFFSILGKIAGMSNTQLGGEMFRTGTKRSIVTANSAADFRYRLALLLADELADALDPAAPAPK